MSVSVSHLLDPRLLTTVASCAMLDAVEQLAPQPSTSGSVEPAVTSFMRSSGKFYS